MRPITFKQLLLSRFCLTYSFSLLQVGYNWHNWIISNWSELAANTTPKTPNPVKTKIFDFVFLRGLSYI
jgi:hypothetical protein